MATSTGDLEQRRDKLIAYPTQSERVFKSRLIEAGIEFEFQLILEPYIVDFLLSKYNLVIELDGDVHNSRAEYDAKRTKYLEGAGFTVLRLRNEEAGTFNFVEMLPGLTEAGIDYRVLAKELADWRALNSSPAVPTLPGGKPHDSIRLGYKKGRPYGSKKAIKKWVKRCSRAWGK